MLQLEGVTVRYGDAIWALQDVNLEVAENKITALLGANGAGKTTVIRVIAGLVRPLAGAVRWQGEILSGPVEERSRQGLAVVPEGRQLWPGLTVAEHLTLAVYPVLGPRQRFRSRLPEAYQARIEQLLDQFPALRRHWRHRAETMSGGEQQMLALARALATNPKLLALDEPSVGLAPLVVEELFGRLESTVRAGMTVLLVEQNAEAALDVADWAYVLQSGRVVASGSRRDLDASGALEEAYLGRSSQAL